MRSGNLERRKSALHAPNAASPPGRENWPTSGTRENAPFRSLFGRTKNQRQEDEGAGCLSVSSAAPGRENPMAIARHHASFGLSAFAVFQIGALTAVLSLIDFEDGHATTRIAIAVLGTLELTIACGMSIYLAFVAFR
jgi:hypothetical protein